MLMESTAVNPNSPSYDRLICLLYRSPVMLLIISTGMELVLVFTLKSISPIASPVILCPLTLHVIPLPISNTIVTSFPLISLRTSLGTTAAPFISTVTVSPSFTWSTSSRITSQPSLPFSPLIKGSSILSSVFVAGLILFPIPGDRFISCVNEPGITIGFIVGLVIFPIPKSVMFPVLPLSLLSPSLSELSPALPLSPPPLMTSLGITVTSFFSPQTMQWWLLLPSEVVVGATSMVHALLNLCAAFTTIPDSMVAWQIVHSLCPSPSVVQVGAFSSVPVYRISPAIWSQEDLVMVTDTVSFS